MQLSFVRRGDKERYFTDFRETDEGGSTWNAEIRRLQVGKPVTLSFSNRSQARPERVAVIDERRDLWFDVTETASYTFVADDQPTRSLKVAAGTEDYIAKATAGIRQAPQKFALQQNYPNPFNPITAIQFSVPELAGTVAMPGAEWASLKVYNMRGQEIVTLYNSPVQAGYYDVLWKGEDYRGRSCATGTYFYRLQVGGQFKKSLKMVMLK